jgi:protein-disulfide isomerase
MRRSLALLSATVLALAVGSSCRRSPGAPATPATPRPTPPAKQDDVLATVDGEPITRAEVDARAAAGLRRVRQEEFDLREQALEQIIGDRLVAREAKAKGVSPEELLRTATAVEAPDPRHVEMLYEQNKARFRDQPKEKVVAQIQEYLSRQGAEAKAAGFREELRKKAAITVSHEAPRVDPQVPKDAPALGPADAPVTIVAFTDYQCPYCHRAQQTIDRVVAEYGPKVRLVHQDYPLDGHPGAIPAARAARCAGEQGKFWEYYRSLMLQPGDFDTADFQKRAAALSLAAPSFGSCLASTRHDGAIQAAQAEGERVGVSGTPAYFVNGRMLSGARPFEDFKKVIDQELARRSS